jgi:hypothetical protein
MNLRHVFGGLCLAFFAAACGGASSDETSGTNNEALKQVGELCGPGAVGGTKCAAGLTCQIQGDIGHCVVAEGRVCGPNAAIKTCPTGYVCSFDGVDVGHCKKPGPAGSSCLANDECAKGTFCQFPVGVCGNNHATPGTCTTEPQVCYELFQPVCGCDGNTYSNTCRAQAAGVSVQAKGACPTAGAACEVASDCHGPLSHLCRVCGDGSDDCEHWACVAGHCKMELCGQ